jgi:uncharacterized protein (DUF2336 family)
MSFDILENSPEVAPLLVRLYDTHNLYNLAGDKDSDDARLELTTIMVDLLKADLSERESELITDVLFALIKKAERDLRMALAERLSTLNNIPLRMVLGLANDEIAVADSILRNSPVLHDMDLIYILQSKGVEHGRSIAHREGLSATMINMLADTKDFEIAVNLSGNDGITLTAHAYGIIADMAQAAPSLSEKLSSRNDLPKDIAARLYDFVGEELKKVLGARFGLDAAKAASVIDEISDEMRQQSDRIVEAHERLMAHAMEMQRRGELRPSTMIAALRRSQPATFIAQFSVFCALPVETVRNMIKQNSGKGLAIACRAMEVGKADFVSIYLLTERMRTTAQRVITHKELSRIMTMFDEINVQEAKRILKNSRN